MATLNSASARAAARDAAIIAAKHAGSVDRDARFPREAFAAIKASRLLGMMAPGELGGAGLSFEDVAAVCSLLAGACASTGLIFAMHQIQIASLVNAGMKSPFHRELLAEIAKAELLVGSATTEGATGGDIRSSDCAVATDGGRITIEKLGTCISYGLDADAILLTARRNPEAPASDQVIVSLRKEDYALSDRAAWDSLGMRGTMSDNFTLRARANAGQVLPKAFIEIAAQSMLPTTHIFWASAWHGLARDAFEKAQAHVRSQARANPGRLAPGAPRLSVAAGKLQLLRASVLDAIHRHNAALGRVDGVDEHSFGIAMSTLKITAGELAVEVVQNAMQVCGLAGYRNDSPQSVTRNLRDAYSALVMINNDRIAANIAAALTVGRLNDALSA